MKKHCLLLLLVLSSCFSPELVQDGDLLLLGHSSVNGKTKSLAMSEDISAANVTVSAHYRGHVASFSENSDGPKVCMEMWLNRHNLGGTVFIAAAPASEPPVNAFGRIDHGCYLNQNTPSQNYATVNPIVTGIRGGKQPTVMSYASGVTSYSAQMLDKFLYGRNTIYEHNGLKEYSYGPGITSGSMINRGGTIAFEQYVALKNWATPSYNFMACGGNPSCPSTGYGKLATIVPEVINAGGWYVNFMHSAWYTDDYPKDYFFKIDSLITASGADVFRGTINTVAEYYYVREAIDSVKAAGDSITIYQTVKNATSPYSKITTPAWVKVDLTGTTLQGKGIVTSHGGKIRSMGNDLYYISVPIDFTEPTKTFHLSESFSPSYINLNKPNVSVVGNTVTSDQPIKIVLYSVLNSDMEVKAVLVERNNTTSTSFTLTKARTPLTKKYFIGYINAEGVSGLNQL